METAYIGTDATPNRLYFVPPQVTEEARPEESAGRSPIELLTDDQKIAIGLIALGYSTNNAARQLDLPRGTFRSQVLKPALQALEAKNKQDAVAKAYEIGLLGEAEAA